MKQILALCEVDDDFADGSELTQDRIKSIEHITAVNPGYHPNVTKFQAHWNAGLSARKNWEVFSENFFKLFTESGLVDEAGLHIEEYDIGSICRFIQTNAETMMSAEFRDSTMYNLLIPSLKIGSMSMRKGKDINVNWPKIASYAKPMAEVVLEQVAKVEARRVIMQPVLDEYFKENIKTGK